MSSINKVVYTARTRTTGGRTGAARSSDGRLDVQLSAPGTAGTGTNPEQLLAAGWSACFIGAIGKAAQAMQISLPADVAVETEVDLGLNHDGYLLQARLNVSLPGIDLAVSQELVDTAHLLCPYSKATRGNIDVAIRVA